MERSKMRKFEKFGRRAGLGLPQYRAELNEALSGCANVTTREKLRRRITRGIPQ